MNSEVINTLMMLLNNGNNPEEIVKTMSKNNPGLAQLLQVYEAQAKGMSPRDFVLQIAKQNGIDPSLLLQTARKFGLK